MKVAFCLFKYYPHGGLSRDCVRIAELCQQRGHVVDLFTMCWQGAIPDNLKVVQIPVNGVTNHQRCASFARNLFNSIETNIYDAIVGFNRMPGLDIYFAGDVCYEYAVRQQHGRLYRLSGRYKAYAALERAVFAPAAKAQILYWAEALKQQYIKYYHTPGDRFHVLTGGLDINCKAPANAHEIRNQVRQFYQLDDKQQLVLLIGSNFKLKGVDRALQAVASLPEKLRNSVVFWIIGQGKERLYQRQAKKLGIASQVKFLGTIDNVPELLLAADLLLHPARREAAGWVILEAIVAGLPVIATTVCGFAEHITRAAAGLVIPDPFAQTTLNESLYEMLGPQKYQACHKHALAYGKNEDLYGHADVVDIIEQLSREKISHTKLGPRLG